MKAAKSEKNLKLAKIGLDNFFTAYEINSDAVNQRNYFNGRKFVFFLNEEQKYEEKNELLHYLKNFYPEAHRLDSKDSNNNSKTLEDVETFLVKSFYEESKEVPKEFQCAISLVR